jgi:hypothetical protein
MTSIIAAICKVLAFRDAAETVLHVALIAKAERTERLGGSILAMMVVSCVYVLHSLG